MSKETKQFVDQFSMSEDVLADVEEEFFQMQPKHTNKMPLERFAEETYRGSLDWVDTQWTKDSSTAQATRNSTWQLSSGESSVHQP